MKNSTGIVMQLDKKYAFIMTNTGEFLKVKVKKAIPDLGEIYTGEVAKEIPFFKHALTAASLVFILLSGSGAYAYYTPTAALTIDINPSIKLQLNRWDRVIKSTPLNNDGEKVLAGLSIKNKPINDALDLIVDEAKKDDFINDKYIESGKAITVSIDENKSNKQFDLSKFEGHAKQNNLNIKINKLDSNKKNPPSNIENKKSNSKNSTDNNKVDNEKNKGNNSITPTADTNSEKDKKSSTSNSSQSNSNNKGNENKDNDKNSNNNGNGQNKADDKNNGYDSIKKNDNKEKNKKSENKEKEKGNSKSKK